MSLKILAYAFVIKKKLFKCNYALKKKKNTLAIHIIVDKYQLLYKIRSV